MALPASGAISLNDVNVELGRSGTTTITMNDSVVRTLFGVASGTIDMNTGHGKANEFTATISSNQTNLNLRTWALANGWGGTSKATITVGSGVYIYSTSTGNAGLTIDGSWPGGITVINNGFIMGKGGRGGGKFPYYGEDGGSAISLGVSCTINNTNGSAYIGGGGGGGGDNWSQENRPVGGSGGGAGGGNGGRNDSASSGAGGGPGSVGSDGTGQSGGAGKDPSPAYAYGGGGGGGRIFPGSGGSGGSGSPSYASPHPARGRGGGAGGGGGAVTFSSGGSGGGGTSSGSGSGGTWFSQSPGGGGGGWGASGGGTAYGGGRSGGKAVQTNGYSVTWTSGDTARVYGSVG